VSGTPSGRVQEHVLMKLALASDHRGYEAKRRLLPTLRKLGHEIEDFGCDSSASCDYPDFAAIAARAVVAGKADAAILLDGTGIGMSLAANKICGVRAALAHDEITARLARENNHCNVLCIGSDLLSEDHLKQIVEIFLSTQFSGGRHQLRVDKVLKLEAEEAVKHARLLSAAPAPSHAPAAERRKVAKEK
jgi:ribose 5-phosphate isomerase B